MARLYNPEEMADLIIAMCLGGVTVHVDAQGYRRSDGVPVYTEDVTDLKLRGHLRPTADNRRLELTMEGKGIGRAFSRDALITLYEQSPIVNEKRSHH